MMKKIFAKKVKNGFATLPVVLVIALLLQIIGVAVLLLSRYSIARSQQFHYSQSALFAAEGALNDWILQFGYEPNWINSSSYSDQVVIGDVPVQRSFTLDPVTGIYHIVIQSNYQGAKRKLVAEYSKNASPAQQEEVVPLDIIFVTDRSKSMTPIMSQLIDAMESLVTSSYLRPEDKIGLVSYNDYAVFEQHLTTDRQKLIDKMNAMTVWGTTFLSEGLFYASQEFETVASDGNEKVLIVFSDGVANKWRSGADVFDCPTDDCFNPASPNNYAPDGGGNLCTNSAISWGDQLRAKGYDLYSVFFAGVPQTVPICGDVTLTVELGRRTMQGLVEDPSHYFETTDQKELEEIFKQIGRQIEETRLRKLQYKEVEPDEG